MLGGCIEAVLVPATFWIVRHAPALRKGRFSSIFLRLWAVLPLSYTVFAALLAIFGKYRAWHVLETYLLGAVIAIPLLSAICMPALLVSAFFIERWTRRGPTFF